MKYSPLVDLIGVRNRRSTITCFLGAFKKLPGENCSAALKRWKMHISLGPGHFLQLGIGIQITVPRIETSTPKELLHVILNYTDLETLANPCKHSSIYWDISVFMWLSMEWLLPQHYACTTDFSALVFFLIQWGELVIHKTRNMHVMAATCILRYLARPQELSKT